MKRLPMTISDISLESVTKKIFMAFLVICPILFVSLGNFGRATLRVNQEQAFQVGAIAFFACFMVSNPYLSAFILLASLNFFLHGFTGGPYLMNILFGVIIYEVSVRVFDRENSTLLFKIIFWLAFANIVWDVFNRFGFDPVFVNLSDGQYGTMKGAALMGQKCFYGMFLAFSLPFALYLYPRVAWLFIVPIYFCDSSSAFFAAVGAILFHVYFKSKKWFSVLSVALVLCGLFYAAKDSTTLPFKHNQSDRLSLWKAVTVDSFKRPFEGWGLDSFRNINMIDQTPKDFLYMTDVETQKAFHTVFIPEKNEFIFPKFMQDKKSATANPWDHPHNEYLMLLFSLGIPGLIILFLMARNIILSFNWICDLNIAVMGYFLVMAIIALAHFPMHVVRIGIFFPVILAVYANLNKKEYING